MRLVFMGTPEFSVKSLRTLYNSHHEIAAVITAVDKARGRGRKVTPSPVKQAALSLGLPVSQPQNLKNQYFVDELGSYQPDLNVVVAFRILPEAVFALPRLGSVNLHASLLPEYRGAAPINWALINGETKTGVTTFLLDKKVDTGAILMQREVEIMPDDDAGSLHDRLMDVGADLLLDTVNGLEKGSLKPKMQGNVDGKSAPKLTVETALINWRQPAEKIVNLIRGLSPYPGAYSLWESKKIIILKSAVEKTHTVAKPGEIIKSSPKEGITVACGTSSLRVLMLKPEGKKAMGSADFVRGYHVKVGSKFKS
jgi:methionyl-tRNA formyltransferase